MVKLAVKPIKKVSKPVGFKTPIKVGYKPTVQPQKKIGINPPKVKMIANPTPKGGVSFTLPVFGGSGGGAYPTNPNNLVPANSANIGQLASNYHKDHPETDVLNPFKVINSFIENINKPDTWFTVVGFLIAIVLILVSLYGIVSSGQKSIINSTFGQNASGLANAIRPKKKGK